MSSGVIDVVAIRKSNGTIECSPFHVKLNNGSRQIKDPKGSSRIVNGTPVPLSMKLGRAGEAFFLERTKVITTREHSSVNKRNNLSASPHTANDIERKSINMTTNQRTRAITEVQRPNNTPHKGNIISSCIN